MVQGVGCRVGCRVWFVGCGIWGFGIQGSGCWLKFYD